jgi:outer membrane protein OmpA-like peptidoglycan-associated protein
MKHSIRLSALVAGLAVAIPSYASAGTMDDLGASFSVGGNQRTAEAMPNVSNVLQQTLFDGYKRMAVQQYNEGNYYAADLWYRKATDAAGMHTMAPEDQANWPSLMDQDRSQFVAARAQLVQWLQTDGQRDPQAAARLQLQYDCWLEETSEQEYNDAAACKPTIPAAVAQAAPPPAPIAAVANCSSNPDGLSENGTLCRTASVAFAFDRYDLLNPGENGDRADTIQSQQAALDLFIRQARSLHPARMDLVGRADTVGSEDYNYGLSLCRARSVEAELRQRGLPANVEVRLIPLGKTTPIVQTGDGIREPANRVVSVAYLMDRAAPSSMKSAPAPAHDLFACGTAKHPFPPSQLMSSKDPAKAKKVKVATN